MSWTVIQTDCLDFLAGLAPGSVDLVFGSPPYESARTYGIDFSVNGQAWVDWMVQVFQASLRACCGLVAFVVEGQTKRFRWSAVPALLMADLHRAKIHLRKPPIFHRIGIPGSGGPDWLRNDYEFIICATSGGKLPWSDNTAMGHRPKWAPGGDMSYRNRDGQRKNARGCSAIKRRLGRGMANGIIGSTKGRCVGKKHVSRGHDTNGDAVTEIAYLPPKRANHGNVISCKVGGGHMGHPLAHRCEAPFPVSLCEFFIVSFCPPNGLVVDPFAGSGTTAHAAVANGRNFAGCDIRQSQVELTIRRLASVTPVMEVMV